ncbi:MAG: leucine-rich repeat protein [Prevotella sp.]|nr:leucine-rich repeat protein [Prevotella sp.]
MRYCEKLSSVTIPASVETVGASPFIGCPELKTLTIEDSDKPMKLEVEGESSFGCGNLETVYMGRDITCVKMRNLKVPQSF